MKKQRIKTTLKTDVQSLCFVAGTLVLTSNGLKKIEDIHVGDKVWSFNEQTLEVEIKEVVSLSQNTSEKLIEITVDNEKIICTPEHPFFVANTWIEAKNLKVGDKLTLKDAKFVSISKIEGLNKTEKVYNFEVVENHNYYISELGVLVHNGCGLELVGDGIKSYKKLDPTKKINVDKAFETLKAGLAGGNQHALSGDLKGFFAMDVKGSGKGRGGLRIIYKKEGDIIQIHNITDYHKK